MLVILIIAISIALIVLLVWLIKQWLFKRNLVFIHKTRNVITFGKKGTGKDLLTQEMIYKINDFYYTNTPGGYGGEFKYLTLTDVSLKPNDYTFFVENKVIKVKRRFKENSNIWISDIGIFLPCYMDTRLYKLYPSMPVLYPISRHLFNGNIHMNCQTLNMGWKALRQQADAFICTKRTIKWLPGYLIVKCVLYDKYESADKNLLPMKTRLLNSYNKALVDQYNATNGDIIEGYVFIKKSHINYDTRAFEKLVYGKTKRIETTKKAKRINFDKINKEIEKDYPTIY